MRRLCIVLALALIAGSAAAAETATDTGTFTFSHEGGLYRLKAENAPLNDILTEIAEATGIAICLDPAEKSRITTDLQRDSLEKLLDALSKSYGIVYVRDKDTKLYKIERIVAASKAAGCELEEGEIERQRVLQAIMNAAANVKRYHLKLTATMMQSGQKMDMDAELWADGEKMRMAGTTKLPGGQETETIMVSDGEVLYNYLAAMKMAMMVDLERVKAEVGEEALKQFRQYDPLDQFEKDTVRYLGVDVLDGEPVYVLEGLSKGAKEIAEALKGEGGNEFVQAMTDSMSEMFDQLTADEPGDPAKKKEVQGKAMDYLKEKMPELLSENMAYKSAVWISSGDGMPRRMTAWNSSGRELMTQVYSDVEVNPSMDEGLFEFDLPEGTKVMDQTQMVIVTTRMTLKKPQP